MPGHSIDGLHKKAQRALKESLAEDEPVLLYIGSKRATLIGTDRRAFIFKTGISAGATFGEKFSSFDYRNISGVQLNKGAFTGSVVLDIAGAAPAGTSYWRQGKNDPWVAQNAIPLSGVTDNARAIVANLRRLIAQAQARQIEHAPASAPAPDIPTQIQALGELRDKSLLTQAEFDAKKTELLSRL